MRDNSKIRQVAKEYIKNHTLTSDQREKLIRDKLERGIQYALQHRQREDLIRDREYR